MIEDKDKSLLLWAKAVLGDSQVEIGSPAMVKPSGTEATVCLYLFQISPEPVSRGARRSRLQVELRYLITACGNNTQDVHGKLSLLAFAAMDEPDFQLEREAPTPEFWLALGVPPQPCLILRTLAVKDLVPVPVKMVRKIVFETVAATELRGFVRGPGDVPLPGAIVELPGLQLSGQTDVNGRFSFALVPETNPPKTIRIHAKGQEHIVNLAESDIHSGPLIVKLELED